MNFYRSFQKLFFNETQLSVNKIAFDDNKYTLNK